MLKRTVVKAFTAALIVLSGAATVCSAADLNITGNVYASACTVSNDIVVGKSVNLGLLGSFDFKQPGDADSSWHNFSLELFNCPEGTTSSTVTFSGTVDGTDATLFANTEPEATAAKNMAVQMSKQSDHSVILSSGSTMTVNVDTASGTASFPLSARMITPTGNAQAGNISSVVLVDFTYQ